MLNPTAWNWSNFTGFFWVSTIQPDSISGIAQQLLTCVPRVESVFSASSTRISDFPSPMVDRLLSSMSYLRSVLLRGNSPILRLMCLTRQLRARRWISTKTSIMAKLGKPRWWGLCFDKDKCVWYLLEVITMAAKDKERPDRLVIDINWRNLPTRHPYYDSHVVSILVVSGVQVKQILLSSRNSLVIVRK